MRTLFFVVVSLLASFAPAQESLGVRLVGSCSEVLDPCDVVVRGEYAYVADGAWGLRIISITDPVHPVQVGYRHTTGMFQMDVVVSGDYAYTADYDQGLRVISIADPTNPVEVGYCDTQDRALGVALNGDYAYVADFNGGLRVISIADPANPVEVGYHGTPDMAMGVAVDGDYVYIAAYGSGLQVHQFFPPGGVETPGAEVRAVNRVPTVVRGVLFLPPSLPTANSSLLSIDGRKVLDLHPGANDVRTLAPGVYFVRGEGRGAGDVGQIRKVVVTR